MSIFGSVRRPSSIRHSCKALAPASTYELRILRSTIRQTFILKAK